MAKNVLGSNVGIGSLDSAVSSGGAGGAAFLSFAAGAATGIGLAGGEEAIGADEAVGAALPTGAAAPDEEVVPSVGAGMNGLAGDPEGTAGLALGEAGGADGVCVCAGAPAAKKAALNSAAANNKRSFIETDPTRGNSLVQIASPQLTCDSS